MLIVCSLEEADEVPFLCELRVCLAARADAIGCVEPDPDPEAGFCTMGEYDTAEIWSRS